jgi:Bacterial mobilisation protein (MobC)
LPRQNNLVQGPGRWPLKTQDACALRSLRLPIMSRPRKNIRRDRQLNLSLTQGEEETVRARAAAAGMRVVDFGRAMLLRARPASAPAQPAEVEVQAASYAERLIYEQLKRLGNNLNQIARRLNATRHAPPPSLEPLLKQIRAILNRGLDHDS